MVYLTVMQQARIWKLHVTTVAAKRKLLLAKEAANSQDEIWCGKKTSIIKKVNL